MRTSRFWYRTRKDKGYTRTLLSLEEKKGWSTQCVCNSCNEKFIRTTKAKHNTDKCDKCYEKPTLTLDAKIKISQAVSAWHSNLDNKNEHAKLVSERYKNPIYSQFHSDACRKRSSTPEYIQKLKDNASRGIDHSIKTSAAKQGITVEEFVDFVTPKDTRERELCKTTVAKECLIRARYRCEVCDNGSIKLNAHHKNGWHWAIDQRFDINNLVCLCKICHKEFHVIYGTKHNTAEQFQEFLSKKSGQ